jgi:hypothetical protein
MLQALLVVERWADGQATPDELQAVLCYGPIILGGSPWDAAAAALDSGDWVVDMEHEMENGYDPFQEDVVFSGDPADFEDKGQCDLLRDIIGNPFRGPSPVDASWLLWNGGTIRGLAQVAYNEKRFEDLPVLADALEEAGCTDEQILAHCRGPGPHVRGCWVVDLILGKS